MVERVNPELMKMQSKQKMKENHKNLKSKLNGIQGENRSTYQIMAEAMGGMSQAQAAQMLTGAMGDAAQDMSQKAAQDMFFGNSNPVASLAENQANAAPYSATGTKAYVHGDWQVQTLLKETSIGKEVERYRVTHIQNGQKVEFSFRHPRVAEMVAAALNESNNVNDPRVSRIIDYCRKEESIMLETKQMVKHYKSLDPGNTKRRGILKTQISEKKLMLEGVRAKLGVL